MELTHVEQLSDAPLQDNAQRNNYKTDTLSITTLQVMLSVSYSECHFDECLGKY
jgi:hypothetical protein